MAFVVEPDLERARRARKALDAAGLHGGRAVVLQSSLDSLPYPDYFANLIVCEDAFSDGVPGTPASEGLRMLKPCGGVAIAGRAPVGEDTAGSGQVEKWLRGLGDPADQGLEVSIRDGWARISRGPLPGAGSWTHQYAERVTCRRRNNIHDKTNNIHTWYNKNTNIVRHFDIQ